MPQDGDPAALWPSWAVERVVVVDHDPAWAGEGSRQVHRLQSLLRSWLAGDVEHIGSTAVPGLAAKPVIDVQAPVADLGVAEAIAAHLDPHHWHYVPPDLDGCPDRRFFVKVLDGRRVAHLHVMAAASTRWQQQLAFRDALRADPALVSAYADLKRQLATRHDLDREAYTSGKQRFVADVLARGDAVDRCAPVAPDERRAT